MKKVAKFVFFTIYEEMRKR